MTFTCVTETSVCWPWTGAINPGGYGRFSIQGKWHLAHRKAYEDANGPIPPGLVIHHTCENPSCVNPEHLEAMTQGEHLMVGDTVPAQHAAATHCPSGHAYAEGNLYVEPKTGWRQCRECRRRHDNARQPRRKRCLTL